MGQIEWTWSFWVWVMDVKVLKILKTWWDSILGKIVSRSIDHTFEKLLAIFCLQTRFEIMKQFEKVFHNL